MKILRTLLATLVLCGAVASVFADKKPQVVRADTIKDRISVRLGDEFTVRFTADGRRNPGKVLGL